MNLAELGRRIKSQRTKKQLTQSQLANSLYISAQAVSKWERGENAPDISLLPKLATLLDRSIEWIISGEEQVLSTFNATVLSSSMRNFLDKTSTMQPENIALWLNGIFHTMTESALVYDAVPVKYTGDGFLCYFAGQHHQQRALNTALKCCRTLGEEDLLVSVHSGDIYLGTIGHQEFATPDIIGDAVNKTFILNRWATKESHAQIVVSEKSYSSCVDTSSTKARKTSLVDMEKVYEIL